MGSIKFGGLDINKIYFGTDEVSKLFLGSEEVYSAEAEIVVDPVLANNSWATIKAVCESGEAANYWSVGDTKTDTGTDGVTRTFRIVDMSGLYGKNVVFEQVELENEQSFGMASWSKSNMRSTVLPATLLKYSSDLQPLVTETTIKTASSASSSTIVETSDKLFLPAEKEINRYLSSWDTEKAALSVYNYWSTHTSSSYYIKYTTTGVAKDYWLRSTEKQYNAIIIVAFNGGSGSTSSANSFCFAPCFSF